MSDEKSLSDILKDISGGQSTRDSNTGNLNSVPNLPLRKLNEGATPKLDLRISHSSLNETDDD